MDNERKIYKKNLIIWLIFLSLIFILSLIAWFLSENESLNIVFISFFISVFPVFCFILSYYFLKRYVTFPIEYFKIFFIMMIAPIIFLIHETNNYIDAVIFFAIVGIVYWIVFKSGKIPENKEKAELLYTKRLGKVFLIFGVLLSLFVVYAFIKNIT